MIPLATDLNRSATMTHDLRSDTTPDFEVGDRVEYTGVAQEFAGRTATVRRVVNGGSAVFLTFHDSDTHFRFPLATKYLTKIDQP